MFTQLRAWDQADHAWAAAAVSRATNEESAGCCLERSTNQRKDKRPSCDSDSATSRDAIPANASRKQDEMETKRATLPTGDGEILK